MNKDVHSDSYYYINSACPVIALSTYCGSMPTYRCVTAALLRCKSRWTRAMS